MNLKEIAALPLRPHISDDIPRICKVFVNVQVDPETNCWIWNGRTNWAGYGIASWDGRKTIAHRIIFTLLKGDIPNGLTLDHLCRVRRCVNPTHLEPVTNTVNFQRACASRNWFVRDTPPCNHPRTPENIAIRPSGGRHCRPCERERNKRRYRENPDRLKNWSKKFLAKMEAEKPGSSRRWMAQKGKAWRINHGQKKKD